MREPRGTSPSEVFRALRGALFNYYNTPFRLADDRLNTERLELLDRSGAVWQPPLLELRPRYISSPQPTAATLYAISAALPAAGRKSDPGDLAELATCGLWSGIPSLYEHQATAIRQAVAGADVVITAGTGSGKTETFLTALMHSLLEESTSWVGDPAPAM